MYSVFPVFAGGPIKGAWESPCDQVEVENEALHNARDGCNSQLSTECHWLCTEIFVVFLFFFLYYFYHLEFSPFYGSWGLNSSLVEGAFMVPPHCSSLFFFFFNTIAFLK